MTYPSITAPKLLLDFSLAGLKKGIYKFFGPVTVSVIITALAQYLPSLQEKLSTTHDLKIVLGTGITAGVIKLLITWLTTSETPASYQTTTLV